MTNGRALATIVGPWLALALVLLVWSAAAQTLQMPVVLPAVGDVLRKLSVLNGDAAWWGHVGATLSAFLAGFSGAFVIGCAIGLPIGLNETARTFIGPTISTLAALPLIAIAPLVIIWLGIADVTRVVIVVAVTSLPIAATLIAALARSTQENASARGGATLAAKAEMQAPKVGLALVRAVRTGVFVGTTAVVISEMIASNRGLGFFVMNATAIFDTPSAMAGVVAIIVLVAMVATILSAIEVLMDGPPA